MRRQEMIRAFTPYELSLFAALEEKTEMREALRIHCGVLLSADPYEREDEIDALARGGN